MNELKKIRNQLGYSQDEMAKVIGVSTSYYSKVEGGFKQPSYQMLKKLKMTFGGQVDMNLFF